MSQRATIWSYHPHLGAVHRELLGYDVEATDGHVGTIVKQSNNAGQAYLVVDTGVWIFGKKRLIPAGVVRDIDDAAKKIYVSMTKHQIKLAPDFAEHRGVRREVHGSYYELALAVSGHGL
jgi:hypothetical protein